MHCIFAYGTLELPDVMEAVTGRRFPSAPAELEGYARSLLHGRPYPGIAPRAGARTAGILYSEVDPASLGLLDRFEGDLYERRAVELRLEAGGSVLAEAYVVRPAHAALLSGEPWDRSRFAALHLPRFLAACRRFRRRAGEAAARALDPARPGGGK